MTKIEEKGKVVLEREREPEKRLILNIYANKCCIHGKHFGSS